MGEHQGMRANYLILPLLLGGLSLPMAVRADNDLFVTGRVREGMSIGEVVAVLGEPQGKIEMETKRESRLVYSKRTLKFIEGHLVRDAQPKSQLPVFTEETGEHGVTELTGNSPVYVSRNDQKREVKLESVLNEVMHVKPGGGSDSSSTPKIIPLQPGIPGGGMVPAVPGNPFGNAMSNRGDGVAITEADEDE